MGKLFDKLFMNGNFFTPYQEPKIDFVGVKGGKIVKYGGKDELKPYDDAAEIIDLKGKYVYPGFTDAHMHLMVYSQKNLYEVALNDITSKEAMMKKVKEFIHEKNIESGEWIIGSGWNQDKFDDTELPDRYLLDEISKEHPICFTRACYHICAVNSKALQLADIDENTVSKNGGRIDKDTKGFPTGILRENAMELVTKVIHGIKDKERMKELIIKGCEDLAKLGVTTVHTDDFPFVEDKEVLWEVLKELAIKDALPIRVVLQLRATEVEDIYRYKKMGMQSWERINNLVVGPIKIIADGSLGAMTAALDKPYEGDIENFGLMLMHEKELDQLIYESFKHNFDIGIHAIGDRTMRVILEIYEKYQHVYKKKGFRPSIIHCQIGSKEILDQFKKLSIIANIQPIFLNTDWKIAENRVGKERLTYSYCWRKYIDMGILCVGSSDAPIESFNPLYGIYTAVTRKDLDGFPEGGWMPEENLNIKEAIHMFTINGSYLSHEEDIKGSIEIGKYADFVVLSDDLCKINKAYIKDVTVEETIVGGEYIFKYA
ncbi:amidohydrolase [Marinisporobacter balticus]|uniref:Amidohydrolase 3 domain-containing protein n=1 Tax=Marinisporobacter balticus TaxID=2018667 RepID=A0A4R2KPS3_9FIRM|nr:amidohydrolase [Marinisporobacter balticus]TCO74762.1 hypothetical protein EV214_11124 [Marinisporobacter balticus]